MRYILIPLCLISDIAYIICKARNKNIIGIIAKGIAALSFIILAYPNKGIFESEFHLTVFVALVFDGIGDLLLSIRNINNDKKWLIIGGLAFMVGHILFVSGLLELNVFYNKIIAFMNIGEVIGIIVIYLITYKTNLSKPLKIFGYIYGALIFTMLSMSICTYIDYRYLNSLILLIGIGLFVFSDVVLIRYNFIHKVKWMHPTYSLCYFIGQILIALSLNL